MGTETNLDSLSAKELLELKETRIKQMKESIKALEVQDEYSRLKANIAENTLREHMSKIKLATMMAKPESEPGQKTKKDEGN